MAENFLLSDKCTTCGCPSFYDTGAIQRTRQGTSWVKIHDQKVSNSSKQFTFSKNTVSTGSTYSKPSDLAYKNIFKVSAYPINHNDPSYHDDCTWKDSGGLELDNSFYRDRSGDTVNMDGGSGLQRATGKRFGSQRSFDTGVMRAWGWGFDANGGGWNATPADATYLAHYFLRSTSVAHVRGYSVDDVASDVRACQVGAIFVYINDVETGSDNVAWGDTPDWLEGAGPYTATDLRNGVNVRPHFNRHFISNRAVGESIIGQIDDIADGSTNSSGLDLRGVEWMVELWKLENTLPARQHGNAGAGAEAHGAYMVHNHYPAEKIAGIKWRRWASSSVQPRALDPSDTTAPYGNFYWPLWSFTQTLNGAIPFSVCPSGTLSRLGFSNADGSDYVPVAPWTFFPEGEYKQTDAHIIDALYGPWATTESGSLTEYGGGNISFDTTGGIVPQDWASSATFPLAQGAGAGRGLVRPNHLQNLAAQYRLRSRGGVWPMLTAQPVFESGGYGNEMLVGANFWGGGVTDSLGNKPYVGFGCNAHFPHFKGKPLHGPFGAPNEGAHMGFHPAAEPPSPEAYARCWELAFSPASPNNREPDSWETCVQADGSFFHQDPTASAYSCPS